MGRIFGRICVNIPTLQQPGHLHFAAGQSRVPPRSTFGLPLSDLPVIWVFVPNHPQYYDCSLAAPDLRAETNWRPNMATGTVKWFNPTKGFGFIQPEDGGDDVFVHISAVEKSELTGLVEGQRVSYDVVSERGKSAAGNLQSA